MEENTITFPPPELEDIYSFPPNVDDDDSEEEEEEEEEEAYIEIDLEATPTDTHVEGEGGGGGEEKSTSDKELEYLPISFSWSNTSTALPSTTTTSTSSASISCAATNSVCPESASELPQLQRNNSWRVYFRVPNRLVSTFVSVLKSDSSETGNKQNGDHLQLGNNRDDCKLVQSRKASRVVTTRMNSRATKLLIKFRSNIKYFRSMLASLTTRPEQVISPGGNTTQDSINKKSEALLSLWNYEKLIKPFEKWSVRRKRGDRTSTNKSSKNTVQAFDRIRRKSCPTSVESSPNQNKIFARDNSVQAAIAHCKRGHSTKRPISVLQR